jgi:hypothetical protein
MRLLGWLPALTTAALLLAPQVAAAQPATSLPPLQIDPGGTELFRGLLDHAGIKPLTAQEFAELKRFDDVILISLGNQRLAPNTASGPFDRFARISASGSILIASDAQVSVTLDAGGADEREFRIGGARVVCSEPGSFHRDEPSCPFVVPIAMEGDEAVHRIFKGLNRVATNSPSYIRPGRWRGGLIRFPLARFPERSFIQGQGLWLPKDAYFAVGGEGPEHQVISTDYRFLMLADHSIFINQMLLEEKTDNLELTYRIIEFLQGPGKQRKRCAFFYDGRLIDHFDDLRQAFAKQNAPSLPQVNLWAMQEKLTDLGNAIIDRLQINNAHNNLILGSGNQNRSLTIITRFFLILAAVVACFILVRRLWRARKPTDTPPPPVVAAASTGPPGVFDRRQKELLRRDNVLEPVRDLVRDFFASIGIPGETGMPKVVIADVVRKPDSLRAAIKDFWNIAYGPPKALTVNRWRELEPFFIRLRQAHMDGKWRFILADSSAGSPA